MIPIKFTGKNPSVLVGVVVAVVAILFFLTPIQVIAEDKIVTQATLLDRIQIEDMLTRYYFDLAQGKSHDLAQYYTEDAILDLNGIVICKGREEIEKRYAGSDDAADATPVGREHILLNNPIINIDGNTATAWAIYTEFMNDDIRKPPRLLQQGREYDELVKLDGRWYIKKRYISADSGLPEERADKIKPRNFR